MVSDEYLIPTAKATLFYKWKELQRVQEDKEFMDQLALTSATL